MLDGLNIIKYIIYHNMSTGMQVCMDNCIVISDIKYK